MLPQNCTNLIINGGVRTCLWREGTECIVEVHLTSIIRLSTITCTTNTFPIFRRAFRSSIFLLTWKFWIPTKPSPPKGILRFVHIYVCRIDVKGCLYDKFSLEQWLLRVNDQPLVTEFCLRFTCVLRDKPISMELATEDAKKWGNL